MTVELRHLRLFLAAADAGRITLAAERLELAQSAASATLRQLEQEVGAPLFRRGPGGIELTAAGDALLARLPAALTAFDDCLDGARRRALDCS
jgi:DNA-binding transcriptional LysR family regulator